MSENYTGTRAVTQTDEPEREPPQGSDRDTDRYAGVWPEKSERWTKPVPSADRGPGITSRNRPQDAPRRP